MLARRLDIHLPNQQSALLFGPRKTGKSTYLRSRFPNSPFFDLLDTDLRLALTKRPALLAEWLAAKRTEELEHPIIIDEVQKVPELMEEVHRLIESRGLRFILCGSSMRKFRRAGAHALGGRGWSYTMFPLVSAEIPDFDLLRALNQGLLPSHYISLRRQRRGAPSRRMCTTTSRGRSKSRRRCGIWRSSAVSSMFWPFRTA